MDDVWKSPNAPKKMGDGPEQENLVRFCHTEFMLLTISGGRSVRNFLKKPKKWPLKKLNEIKLKSSWNKLYWIQLIN